MSRFSSDRVYDSFYQDVSKARMPGSALEERILFYRYHVLGDLSARDNLISGNLRFVIKTARQFYRGDTDFLHVLIAAGNVGLVVAIDRYCPWVIPCHLCTTQNYVKNTKGQRCKACKGRLRKRNAQRYATRFLTYAHWWIIESMRTELYNNSLVHIPPYKQKEHNQQRRNGETVGPTYVVYDEAEYDEALRGQYTVQQHITNEYSEEEQLSTHAKEFLRKVLDTMNPRQAYVLLTYYGLREDPKNLREIAATLGVCPERVRQIKERGIRELRIRLRKRRVTQVSDIFN